MKRHKILAWTGRITGLLVIAFFLLFFLGDGFPDIINSRGNELLRFFPFSLVSLIGFIIAWQRPATGGWLMIVGGLLMGGYFLYYHDLNVAIIYALPSLLIGLCFLAAEDKVLV